MICLRFAFSFCVLDFKNVTKFQIHNEFFKIAKEIVKKQLKVFRFSVRISPKGQIENGIMYSPAPCGRMNGGKKESLALKILFFLV